MLREFPLAGQMAERVGPDGRPRHDPAQVRAAATVMLVRPGPGRGVQVFAFRRVPRMAFAAGMLVFPGGSVDPGDGDPAVPWHPGPPPEAAPAGAAVRETFEECGVLLARRLHGPAPDAVELSAPGWEERRLALAAGQVPLAAALGAAGLVADAAALHPWARWVTPAFESRRFDTWFYVAALPPGQEARDLGGEGERAAWLDPAEALTRHRAGDLPMLPPTLVCLEELAAAGSVDELLATPRQVRPVSPWVARGAGGEPVLRIDLDGRGGGDPPQEP